MLRLLFIFSLLTLVNLAKAQVIPSSCMAPDSLIKKYSESAWYIAWQDMNHAGYFDSINIPTASKNKILDAIIAVYNTTGSERDSIFKFRNITSYISTSMNKLIIICDTSLFWGKELSLGNLNTGYAKLDSMLDYYQFDSIRESHIYTDRRWFTLYTDSFYNMVALSLQFDSLPSVLASPYNTGGDGNNIIDSIGIHSIDLAFTYGWQDCLVSCYFRKFWHYRVFDDCSVEYLGAVLSPYLGIPTNELVDKIQIFPNPVTSEIYFTNSEQLLSYTIYDIKGQIVKVQPFFKQGLDNNISDISSGMYFVKLITKQGVYTEIIVKD